MKTSLSLIILTYNEALNLEKCLRSTEGLVSEIIIVDSGSTDDTKEIAEKFGARFFVHEFKNQAEQFNWALEFIDPCGEWIMRLDADEELLPELKKEIEEKLPITPETVGGFYLNRRNYFLGKWIRHGGYYPTWFLRVFRKGWAKSEVREMDEHLVLLRGTSERFKNDFIDNNLKGLTDWKKKHRNYAEREARSYYREKIEEKSELTMEQAGRKRWVKKNIYYRLPPFLRVFFYFLYRYFFLLGFLDGWRGTQFHILQGVWYRGLIDKNIVFFKDKKRVFEEKA